MNNKTVTAKDLSGNLIFLCLFSIYSTLIMGRGLSLVSVRRIVLFLTRLVIHCRHCFLLILLRICKTVSNTGAQYAQGRRQRGVQWCPVPPFHVWPPGCCIHPMQYFSNVPPLLFFGPPCCYNLATGLSMPWDVYCKYVLEMYEVVWAPIVLLFTMQLVKNGSPSFWTRFKSFVI